MDWKWKRLFQTEVTEAKSTQRLDSTLLVQGTMLSSEGHGVQSAQEIQLETQAGTCALKCKGATC